MKSIHSLFSSAAARLVAVAALLLLVLVPIAAHASPTQYVVGLGRVTYPLGVQTPDTLAGFTIEFSNASTIATTDTLAPFYVGGLNYTPTAAGATNTNNVVRIVVQGVPQLVAGDSIYVWADYALNKTGPWFTVKTSTSANAILLNGLGAGVADTVGVGTWLTYPGAYSVNGSGTGVSVGSNSVQAVPNVYSGFLTLQTSAAAIANVAQPFAWNWCRLRLAGDHGASAPIYSASVSVVVPSDVAPQFTAGPKQ